MSVSDHSDGLDMSITVGSELVTLDDMEQFVLRLRKLGAPGETWIRGATKAELTLGSLPRLRTLRADFISHIDRPHSTEANWPEKRNG